MPKDTYCRERLGFYKLFQLIFFHHGSTEYVEIALGWILLNHANSDRISRISRILFCLHQFPEIKNEQSSISCRSCQKISRYKIESNHKIQVLTRDQNRGPGGFACLQIAMGLGGIRQWICLLDFDFYRTTFHDIEQITGMFQ